MIEFTNAFKASNGLIYDTLEGAQAQEMTAVIIDSGVAVDPSACAEIALRIVKSKDKVLDILTTTKTSRPKARKINGGKKARKTNPEVTP